MKKWAQKWLGWIPGFLDWCDNQMKRARIIGILITVVLGIHDYSTNKAEGQEENRRHKAEHDRDAYAHQRDSIEVRYINNRRYAQ